MLAADLLDRRSWSWSLAAWALGLLLTASAASAAPVARVADLTLTADFDGFATIVVSAQDVAITVDDQTGAVSLPAGALQLQSPVVVPVTATTAVAQVTAQTVTNQAGAFSVGGAQGLANEPNCPNTASGQACVDGAGLGGPMGLTGSVNIHVVPNALVIPVDLNLARVGQGGTAVTGVLGFDAAPWSVGRGEIRLFSTPLSASVTIAQTGSQTASMITLVSPTFVQAFGNLLPVQTTLQIALEPLPPDPGPTPVPVVGAAGLRLLGLGVLLLGAGLSLRRRAAGRSR